MHEPNFLLINCRFWHSRVLITRLNHEARDIKCISFHEPLIAILHNHAVNQCDILSDIIRRKQLYPTGRKLSHIFFFCYTKNILCESFLPVNYKNAPTLPAKFMFNPQCTEDFANRDLLSGVHWTPTIFFHFLCNYFDYKRFLLE